MAWFYTATLAWNPSGVDTCGTTAAISKICLELRSGSATVLFDLARALDQLAPLELDMLSKAQRGYELLGRNRNPWIKSQATDLASGMTAAEGFQVIAFACLRHFRLNQSLLRSNENPEALHQLRVALRRLCSALSIFSEMLAGDRLVHIRGELRWIAGELDMARNLDVLLASVGSADVRTSLRLARAQAYAGVTAALTSPRLRVLMLDLVEWITIGKWLVVPIDKSLIERPIGRFAATALDRCRRDVDRRGRHRQHLDDEARHRLRIGVKKLHYAQPISSAGCSWGSRRGTSARLSSLFWKTFRICLESFTIR